LDVLSEQYIPSGETGTSIRIKFHSDNYNKFHEAIQRAVYFWKESERPTSNLQDLKYFTPELTIGGALNISTRCNETFSEIIDNTWEKCIFNIDGIPYDIPRTLDIPELKAVTGRVNGRATINLVPRLWKFPRQEKL